MVDTEMCLVKCLFVYWICLLICTGAYDWAKNTLKDHAKDRRTYVYTKEQLENGKTHEQLWNAAQVAIK